MARNYLEQERDVLVRLVAAGPGALDDTEALQVCAGLTAAQVAAMIDEFGSLPEVLAASPAALARHAPAVAAARLALSRDLALRLLRAPLRQRTPLGGWSAAADYLKVALRGRTREEFRVLFLDRGDRLVRDEILGEGTVDHVPVYPREVLRRALELDAAALILAHNHPGGDPKPSPADEAATRQIVDAGRLLRVSVHDHFLVAGEAVVSFKSLGLL